MSGVSMVWALMSMTPSPKEDEYLLMASSAPAVIFYSSLRHWYTRSASWNVKGETVR